MLQLQDQSPKNNAISHSIYSSNGGTLSDAGAVLSQVATNDIPNFNDDKFDELPSFKDAQLKAPMKSLSSTISCASQSRSGWGVPMWIGLRGGAGGDTSVANGTSGWGPPPSSAAASASGWGAPPPPNPAASAAWGAPLSAGQGNKTQNGE